MRFLILLLVLPALALKSQKLNKDSLSKSITAFQAELNKEYADSIHSPLTKEDRLKFTALDFFPANLNYCVVTKFVRTPDEKSFEMKTTTDRKPLYLKYGEVHFTLNGKKHKLNVYQNLAPLTNAMYKDFLFLPFKDLTSGNASYGGGRFIDLKIPAGDKMVIDFNKAYNPYCAYNHAYSCPIPPPENFLNTEVKAGVKAPHE